MPEQGIFTELNQKLESVWKENATQIYKLCALRSDSPEAADDLFQDVALKFCKTASSLNLDEPMFHWFSVVVKNAHYDQYRRNVREMPFSCLADNQVSYDDFPLNASVHFTDDNRETRIEEELAFLMSELSNFEKKSVKLTYIEGLTLMEASVAQRVSKCVLIKRRRGAILKMQKKRDERDEMMKKNNVPTLILEDLLNQAG